MTRMERKKNENIKQSRTGSRTGIKAFIILCLVFLVLIGVKQVDDVSRSMLMIEEPKALGYNKINNDLHQIYLFGQELYIDEENIREVYGFVKNELEVFIKLVNDKRNKFVQKD